MSSITTLIRRLIMFSGLITAGVLIALTAITLVTPTHTGSAQGGSVCPPIVGRALESVGSACAGLGRNSACYGYRSVSATFSNPQPSGTFTRVGDIADLLTLETVRTAPLDLARDQWGVALMNVQASLPNTLPGQNLTFLLLGDAQVENAVAPETAFRGGLPVNVRTIVSANLYQIPSLDGAVIGTLDADVPLPADARSTDDAWFRVTYNGQYGWAARSILEVPAPAARLPVYSVETNPAPMQAFFLRTGAGSPVCSDAPDALVIQGPQNLTVDLNINGANLRIGSTVVLRTIPVGNPDAGPLPDDLSDLVSGFLQISVLDGEVIVEPDSDNPVVIGDDQTTLTCLDVPQNLGIDGQANDQLVTDACGGWEEPASIPDELRERLRLIDDYPLSYPIPVFDNATAESTAPTEATTEPNPPTAAPTTTPPPTSTIAPNATLTPIPTSMASATPGASPTPTITPIPGTTDAFFSTAIFSFGSSIGYDQVTLTYIVRNNGPSDTGTMTITGLRPAGSYGGFPNPNDDFFVRSMSWSGDYDSTTDTWIPFGSLAANSFGYTLTMTMDILDGAYGKTFTANPVITTTNPDGDLSNNTAAVTFTIESRANLAVTVQDIPPVVAGETTSVTVVARNLSGRNVRNVSVALSASSLDVDLISGTATQGTFDGAADVWSIPLLAPGQSETLTVTMLPAIATGGISQSVTAAITALNHVETVPGNETSTDLFTPIVNTMDLTVTLDSVAPNLTYYPTGGTVTLLFDITNTGSAAANTVSIADVLPAELTYIPASATGDGVYIDTTDTWTIPQVLAGQTVTFGVTASIGSGAAGTVISHNLTVGAASPAESNLLNNTLAYNLAVESAQDLDVAVTAPASQAGTNVSYTVTASNTGTGPVDNIVVTLTSPGGLSFVSSSSPLSGNDWIVGTLPGGGFAVLTVTYFIPEGQANIAQTLDASIASSSNSDSNPLNDTGSGSTTPTYANVDVGFTNLSASPGPYQELTGHSLTYEVTNGSATTPAVNVVITDVLPSNVTYGTYTGPGTYTPGTETLTIASIAPGNTVFLTFTFTIDSGTSGLVLSNTANLTADNDSTPGNNSQPVNFYVNTSADLGVTVVPSTLTPTIGVPFTVDVTVTNTNLFQTVLDIAVPYNVPAGLTVNSGGGPWNIASLVPGASTTFTLNLTATAPTAGVPQLIQAGPVSGANNNDAITGNDSGSTSVTPAVGLVDVGFSGLNIVSAPYEEGETIFITHSINNTDLSSPALNITITDLLPSGVTYVSYGGPGTYTPGTDTLVIPSLAANSSANLAFTVTVNAGTANTILSASATLSASNDASGGDNTNVIGIVVSTTADLQVLTTVSTTTPVENVPFTATMTVTNASAVHTVTNIGMNYSTAAGLTVNTLTPSSGTASAGAWSIGSLGPGGTATLTFNLTAPPPTVGIGQLISAFGLTAATNVDTNNLNNSFDITVTPTAPVVCDASGINSPAALVTAVENANNEGLCPGPNTLTLTSGSFTMSAYAGSPLNALPPITSSITLNGSGAYVNRAASGFRFAQVTTGGVLTINTADFQDFDLPGNNGGTFLVDGSGRLVLRAVTIRDGSASLGGAIYTGSSAANSVDLINVTMWLNAASSGGGVYTAASSPINIAFTALQGNTGGNIAGSGSTVINAKNSIFVGSPTNCGTGIALVNNGGNAVDIADNVCIGLPVYVFSVNSYVSPPLSPSYISWNTSAHMNTVVDCTDNGGTPVTTGAQGVARPQGPACDPGPNESP